MPDIECDRARASKDGEAETRCCTAEQLSASALNSQAPAYGTAYLVMHSCATVKTMLMTEAPFDRDCELQSVGLSLLA